MASFQNAYVKVSLSGTDNSLGGYLLQGSLNLAVSSLLSVNYYDQYDFKGLQAALSDVTKLNYTTVSPYDAEYGETTPAVKGLLTGSRTYQMTDPTQYSAAAIYYDQVGRMVQSHASNHLGGFEDNFMALTFTGKVIQKMHQHSATGKTPLTEIYTYIYDNAERLTTTNYQLDTLAMFTLSVNTYDEVGRLKSKTIPTSTTADTTSYTYNVRSWLTQIAGSHFSQTLTYNAAVGAL